MYHENRKVVLPTAPHIYVDAMGKSCNAWFNMERIASNLVENTEALSAVTTLNFCKLSTIFTDTSDTEQLTAAAQAVWEIVEQEAALLADDNSDGFDRVFVGGLSLGARTALATLMKQPVDSSPLGGYFIMSGGVNLQPDGASTDCHPLSLPPQA